MNAAARNGRGLSAARPPTSPAAVLVVTVVLMWALGGVLGLVWQWWSPPGPAGYVISPGAIQPDETEAFVAADGRYAAIVLGVGLIAGLALWFARICRGGSAVLVLAVGGLGGAGAMAVVGHVVRGSGRHYSCGGGTATCINHLPLSVHASGLLLLEAAAAVLVYGLCVSFSRADDLGLPDPDRELARRLTGRAAIGVDALPQHLGRHRGSIGDPEPEPGDPPER